MNKLFNLLALLMLLKLVTACQNLKKMLPEGPALTTKERQEVLSQPAHNIKYTDKTKVDYPISPVQVWAATYELDLILVSKHPYWNMHEFAKLATPQGDLWLMKDAKEPELDQYITADLEDIDSWLPELPVARQSYPVKVVDSSNRKMLDLRFSYQNINGEKVEVSYQGKWPKTTLKKKNGSTMGHSRNQLLVGLDLPYRDFGKKATISYDGKFYKMDKLLGLVPFQMALTQTQGGASAGHFELEKKDGKLTSIHKTNKTTIPQDWTVIETDKKTTLSQKNDFRTSSYVFDKENNHLHLKEAYVQQWNKAEKGVKMTFSPALPDLRCPFEGDYQSNFVLDIAGDNNNVTGTVTAKWENGEAILLVNPSKPWWVTDRPMKTVIKYDNNKADINIKMLPLSVQK